MQRYHCQKTAPEGRVAAGQRRAGHGLHVVVALRVDVERLRAHINEVDQLRGLHTEHSSRCSTPPYTAELLKHQHLGLLTDTTGRLPVRMDRRCEQAELA